MIMKDKKLKETMDNMEGAIITIDPKSDTTLNPFEVDGTDEDKSREVLSELVKLLEDNGYTEEQIEELKSMNDAVSIEEQIDNIETEMGYWDC